MSCEIVSSSPAIFRKDEVVRKKWTKFNNFSVVIKKMKGGWRKRNVGAVKAEMGIKYEIR